VARPRSRVRPLEAPGNRRTREMAVVSSSGDRLGEQNPAYRPSLAFFFLFSRFRDTDSGSSPQCTEPVPIEARSRGRDQPPEDRIPLYAWRG
jgi:hypothetical protein